MSVNSHSRLSDFLSHHPFTVLLNLKCFPNCCPVYDSSYSISFIKQNLVKSLLSFLRRIQIFSPVHSKYFCIYPVIKQSDGQYVINQPGGPETETGEVRIGDSSDAVMVYTRGDGVAISERITMEGPLKQSLHLGVRNIFDNCFC